MWLRDAEQAWIRAKILSKEAADFTLHLQTSGGRKQKVQCHDFKETDDIKLCNVVRDTSIVASEKENASSKKTHEVDDLISLTHLHEPAILHALEMRFGHDIIYTSTGPILIAVNPFKAVSLYTEQVFLALHFCLRLITSCGICRFCGSMNSTELQSLMVRALPICRRTPTQWSVGFCFILSACLSTKYNINSFCVHTVGRPRLSFYGGPA